MVLLLLCLVFVGFFQCCKLYQLCKIIEKRPAEQLKKAPPKARNSFVVKRMEERIKEALYE